VISTFQPWDQIQKFKVTVCDLERKTKSQGLLQRFGEQFGHVFWPKIR